MTSKKILLAEDDGDDRIFFFDFLQDRRDVFLMPAVENGEDLMNLLESLDDEHLPHAIILDQNMPKCNGLQTLALLKQNSRFSRIPVMLYSTFADETLLQKSTAAGASFLISKPATSEGYNNMIDQLLKAI